jgi:hypothetical protein
MPFKSQAQRRKFAQLLVEGKISPETFEEWNRETGARKLPERARDADKRKAKLAKRRPVAKRAMAPRSRTRKTTKRAPTKR